MRKIILLLCLFSTFVYGQEFENVGFESTSCVADCDDVNGQMSCVDGWTSQYTVGIVPLKNVNCDPDFVCNGNNSIWLVTTSGSPGSSIRTANPFFNQNPSETHVVNLTVNRSSDGVQNGGITISGKFAGQNNWAPVGFGAPANSDVCEDITIVLDSSVTQYEELSFHATTPSGGHGGLGNFIVVDDIQVGGPVIDISDECGILTVAIDSNFNVDIENFEVQILNDMGDEIAYLWNETGAPLTFDIGQVGSFTLNIFIGFLNSGNYEYIYYEDVPYTIDTVDCCTDEPYVEPHWALCDSDNVCEMESWPVRVLDDDGTPLLAIDGYTFEWSVNGNVVGTGDVLYGVMEDTTYTVTVTYPDGCEYTITYYEECCEPEEIRITANEGDITDTLTYTIPCGEDCVYIQATNVIDAVYNSSDPVLTDLNGIFCLYEADLDSFTATITGFDTCGDPYTQDIHIIVEQNCCLDDISVEFDECPESELENAILQGGDDKVSDAIVSFEEAHNLMKKADVIIDECDPCDIGVVVATVVDAGGNQITNFDNINVSWDANPNGTNISNSQFLVLVDVLYTVTVTVTDDDGQECVYTYDFIYECEEKCEELPAPTNLQATGSTLSWDPVPGAVSYIVSSPSVIRIECCLKGGVSIAPIPTTNTFVNLSTSLQSRCFVWTVTAVCADGSLSPVSNQACHYPSLIQHVQDVVISPNPNNGRMHITWDTQKEIALEIYRFDGTLVKALNYGKTNDASFQMDLELNLPSGLYLFTFRSEDQIISKRVIIE